MQLHASTNLHPHAYVRVQSLYTILVFHTQNRVPFDLIPTFIRLLPEQHILFPTPGSQAVLLLFSVTMIPYETVYGTMIVILLNYLLPPVWSHALIIAGLLFCQTGLTNSTFSHAVTLVWRVDHPYRCISAFFPGNLFVAGVCQVVFQEDFPSPASYARCSRIIYCAWLSIQLLVPPASSPTMTTALSISAINCFQFYRGFPCLVKT